MSRRKLKDVDMSLVTRYMIEYDCNLDEAIAAVSSGEGISKTENTTSQPVPKRNKLPRRVAEESSVAEKPKTKLKAARIAAGLSQSELALKADLNLRTLQAYEQGYKAFDNARLDTIFKVALLCKCKLEDLIENKDFLELITKYNEA